MKIGVNFLRESIIVKVVHHILEEICHHTEDQAKPFQCNFCDLIMENKFITSLEGWRAITLESYCISLIIKELCNHTRKASDPSFSR